MMDYMLKTSHEQWSAGTRVSLMEIVSAQEKIGLVKMCHSINHPRGGLYKPEFEIPLDKLREAKSRTVIVPVINGKERRRKVRIAMRAISH